MRPSPSPELALQLERHVQVRTNWRIRDLAIELKPGRAILRGQASSNFTRQLAQHAVQDLLPDVRLENALAIDNSVEFLLALPLRVNAYFDGRSNDHRGHQTAQAFMSLGVPA
jgi:hypothetical protein